MNAAEIEVLKSKMPEMGTMVEDMKLGLFLENQSDYSLEEFEKLIKNGKKFLTINN